MRSGDPRFVRESRSEVRHSAEIDPGSREDDSSESGNAEEEEMKHASNRSARSVEIPRARRQATDAAFSESSVRLETYESKHSADISGLHGGTAGYAGLGSDRQGGSRI